MDFNELTAEQKQKVVSDLLSDIERYQEHLHDIKELGLVPEYKKIVKE